MFKLTTLSLVACSLLAAPTTAQYVTAAVNSEPFQGISIQTNRADIYGITTGQTDFKLTYPARTAYTLTAPKTATLSGRLARFHHWELQASPVGSPISKPAGENVLTVTSIGTLNDTCTAVYIFERQVSVRSIGATDVPIELNKPDAWGDQNGNTQFFRKFALGTQDVRFTAPLEHNGMRFHHWVVGTNELRQGIRTVQMNIGDSYTTITAHYREFVMGAHTRIGLGCEGSNGKRPRLTPTYNPNIGLTTQYRLYDGPALAGCSLAVGVSDTTWNGAPLPLRLPGTLCNVYTDPTIVVPVATSVTGYAMVPVQIPNDTNLIGLVGYTQYWCVDLNANSLNLTTSDAYRTLVGGWK